MTTLARIVVGHTSGTSAIGDCRGGFASGLEIN